MQVCGKCNAALIGARKFCASCGAAVEPRRIDSPSSSPAVPSTTAPSTASPSASSPSGAASSIDAQSAPSSPVSAGAPQLGPKGTVAFGYVVRPPIPGMSKAPAKGGAGLPASLSPAAGTPAVSPSVSAERASRSPSSAVDPFASTTNEPGGMAAARASARPSSVGAPGGVTRDMPHSPSPVDLDQLSPLAASAILPPAVAAEARRSSASAFASPALPRASHGASSGNQGGGAGSAPPAPTRAMISWSGQWLPGTVLNVHGNKCLVQFANGSQLWVESHFVKPV